MSEDRALYPFATAYPHHSEPLFLLLFQSHYYGIKNAKGLLGVKNICTYCYRSYRDINRHHCPGRCALCHNSSCTPHQSESGVCADCHRLVKLAHGEIRSDAGFNHATQ